jgi:hypothetical protein
MPDEKQEQEQPGQARRVKFAVWVLPDLEARFRKKAKDLNVSAGVLMEMIISNFDRLRVVDIDGKPPEFE